MTDSPAWASLARPRRPKGASSIACLAFVALMGGAFWAGAVWIGQTLMHVLAR